MGTTVGGDEGDRVGVGDAVDDAELVEVRRKMRRNGKRKRNRTCFISVSRSSP